MLMLPAKTVTPAPLAMLNFQRVFVRNSLSLASPADIKQSQGCIRIDQVLPKVVGFVEVIVGLADELQHTAVVASLTALYT